MAFVTVLSGLTGCDLDSPDSATQADIVITPNHVNIGLHQSVEFVASGWYDYTWDLANNTWGTLSHRTGKSTVYTSVASTGGVQVLTCSAIITGTNGTASVTTEALIVHQ